MALPRFLSLADFGVLAVVAVAIFLPAREMYASNAIKGDEFTVALAEARTMARPDDGKAIEDFVRAMSEAGMKDWAVEASMRMSVRAKDSPSRWRALQATSGALMEKLDARGALDYANQAIEACDAVRVAEKHKAEAAGQKPADVDAAMERVCPSFERVRIQIYQEHLHLGVQSGINPRVDPKGFREASSKGGGFLNIRLGPAVPQSPPPEGSGSAGSAQ